MSTPAARPDRMATYSPQCSSPSRAHTRKKEMTAMRDGGQIGAAGQRLQQGALVGILLRLNEEGADDGAQDAHGRHDHGG